MALRFYSFFFLAIHCISLWRLSIARRLEVDLSVGNALTLESCESLNSESANPSGNVEVQVLNKLGNGGFSEVFKTELDGSIVAMKLYDVREARPLDVEAVDAALNVEKAIIKLELPMCVKGYLFCRVQGDDSKRALLEELLVKKDSSSVTQVDKLKFYKTMYERGYVPLDVGSDNAWHTSQGFVFFDFNAFLDLRTPSAHDTHFFPEAFDPRFRLQFSPSDQQVLVKALQSFATSHSGNDVIQDNIVQEISMLKWGSASKQQSNKKQF